MREIARNPAATPVHAYGVEFARTAKMRVIPHVLAAPAEPLHPGWPEKEIYVCHTFVLLVS